MFIKLVGHTILSSSKARPCKMVYRLLDVSSSGFNFSIAASCFEQTKIASIKPCFREHGNSNFNEGTTLKEQINTLLT